MTIATPTERSVQGRLIRTVLARVAGGMFVLWGAITLSFFGLHLAPGDTAELIVGQVDNIGETDAAVIELARQQWGLDRPILVQYADFLGRAFSGDWGLSYVESRPVSDVLLSRIWPTIELGLLGFTASVVLAVLIAVLSNIRSGPVREAINAIELVFASLPSFWLGLILLFIFSFQLKLFPVSGTDGWQSQVLPVATLAIPITAYLTQLLRGELDHHADAQFGVTAASRGTGPFRLVWRHTLRHSLIPVVTVSGTILGSLLGGAILIEQIFGRTGLGKITVLAVQRHDIPVVLAVVTISAFVYVALSTIVDLLYLVLDPRLRHG